jgi:hypothetical protein
MPVEGRDLSSRQTQYVVKDLEIGQPINSASVQKLQTALHAKRRREVLSESRMREICMSGCVSSKDWCVQQEIDLPGQESGAP